jgi:hypothetical protein
LNDLRGHGVHIRSFLFFATEGTEYTGIRKSKIKNIETKKEPEEEKQSKREIDFVFPI